MVRLKHLNKLMLFIILLLIKVVLYIHLDHYGGNIGLTITQTIRLTGIIQWGVRQLSVLENQMTSVERILEYTNLPQEADFQTLFGTYYNNKFIK